MQLSRPGTSTAPSAPGVGLSPWSVSSHHSHTAPCRARALDLVAIGYQLAAATSDDVDAASLRRVWLDYVIPASVDPLETWSLGTTCRIHGLKAWPGEWAGRIAVSAERDGRWKVLAQGPDGLGEACVRPANLAPSRGLAEVLSAARRVPCGERVERAAPSGHQLCMPCGPEEDGPAGDLLAAAIGSLAISPSPPGTPPTPPTPPTPVLRQ